MKCRSRAVATMRFRPLKVAVIAILAGITSGVDVHERVRRSGPTADSNFDYLSGPLDFEDSFSPSDNGNIVGQASLLRLAASSTIRLGLSVWIKDNGVSAQQITGVLYSGTCATSGSNNRALDVSNTLVPSFSGLGTSVGGGVSATAEIDVAGVLSSYDDLSIMLQDSTSARLACADLSSSRSINGFVGSINVSYFSLGESLPTVSTVTVLRTETGSTTISFTASNYRANFPYSAHIYSTPCDSTVASPFFTRNGSQIEVPFGLGSSGQSLLVSTTIDEVLSPSAMSMVIRDCRTLPDAPDFTGNCIGGQPVLMCMTMSDSVDTSASTIGSTTVQTTTQDLCNVPDILSVGRCLNWVNLGYCAEGHRFYSYMQSNCRFSCNDCATAPPFITTSTTTTTTPTTTTTRAATTDASSTTLASTTSRSTTTTSVEAQDRQFGTDSTTTVSGGISCSQIDEQPHSKCTNWRDSGYCNPDSEWFGFMLTNCARTCACSEYGGSDSLATEYLNGNGGAFSATTIIYTNPCSGISMNAESIVSGEISQLEFLPRSASSAGCCLEVIPPPGITAWNFQSLTTQTLSKSDNTVIVVLSAVGIVLAGLGLVHRLTQSRDSTLDDDSYRSEYAVIHFMGTDDVGAVQTSSMAQNLNVKPFQSHVVARSPPRRGKP